MAIFIYYKLYGSLHTMDMACLYQGRLPPAPDLVQSVNLIDKVIETGKLAFLQEW